MYFIDIFGIGDFDISLDTDVMSHLSEFTVFLPHRHSRWVKLSWNCSLNDKQANVIISGDEMFSDTYRMKLVDEVIYEVTGKLETRQQGEVRIEGFNPSAEEADEGTDSTMESGVDIVLNHRLVETFAFGDKKSYTLYLKDYMKKWVFRDHN